jgi:hypothetical protein
MLELVGQQEVLLIWRHYPRDILLVFMVIASDSMRVVHSNLSFHMKIGPFYRQIENSSK